MHLDRLRHHPSAWPARLLYQAIKRKVLALTQGGSPVSLSCQISNIKEIYKKAGLDPCVGTFVEIGAFDGENFSNTSFLADQGWRGIYFEPISHHARLARVRHCLNRVKVFTFGIGPERGAFEIAAMGPLSTMKRENYLAFKKISWAAEAAAKARFESVQIVPLESAFNLARVPKRIDLLVVDTEGSEEEIMAMFLKSGWLARVAIVELEDAHESFLLERDLVVRHERVREWMHAAGYRELYRDSINTVFINEKA